MHFHPPVRAKMILPSAFEIPNCCNCMVEVGEIGPTIEKFHLAGTSQSQAFEVPLTKNIQPMARLCSSQSTDADRAELNEKSFQNETDSV